MFVIILFILILNIVSILLMYRSLNDRTPKEKLIYIAMGIAVMYILTSIVYWISTRNIEMTEVSDLGKDLIIFLFVPINGIIVLPLSARSYCKFKGGGISGTVLRNRGTVLGIILLILLIIECVYFENIQNQVVKMITDRNNQVQQETTNELSAEQSNEIVNNTDTTNQIEIENVEVVNDTFTNESAEQTNSELDNVVEAVPSNVTE